jgi:peptidyl-prolyl cis-trans isomerase B (cyclophilin B)
VSGKQSKREARRQKEAAREEARRQERRQTMITMGIIGMIVVLGGVLIWASLEREPDPLAELEDLEDPDDILDPEDDPLADRPVACDGEVPPAAEEEKPTYSEPEQVIEDGVDYRAVVETSCGTVTIDLDQDRAPETVNSFVFLAQEGFFDGLEIFRNATTIGALQTGAGTNDAGWDIGYTIPDELAAAEEDGYPPGAVAMANAGPDTGGSQFFFVYNDLFTLEPAYARFGMVVEGLDVLETIGDIEVAGETPLEIIYMERVTIEAAGADEAPEPPAEEEEEEQP